MKGFWVLTANIDKLMKCKICRNLAIKSGRTASVNQRFKCRCCSRTFVDSAMPNYIPDWKRELIRGLRYSGLSVRQIASIAGAARNTVDRYIGDISVNCECGDKVTHHGWCSYRYKQSARRQQFLHNTGTDYKSLPGLYLIRMCPVCQLPIEIALRHKTCVMKVCQEERDRYAPILVMKEQVEEVEKILRQIKEITENVKEQKEDRRFA